MTPMASRVKSESIFPGAHLDDQRLERGLKQPMLIKHYIELKGRFASFSVDDSLNDTLDGLVFVRVQDISSKMRARLTGSPSK